MGYIGFNKYIIPIHFNFLKPFLNVVFKKRTIKYICIFLLERASLDLPFYR